MTYLLATQMLPRGGDLQLELIDERSPAQQRQDAGVTRENGSYAHSDDTGFHVHDGRAMNFKRFQEFRYAGRGMFPSAAIKHGDDLFVGLNSGEIHQYDKEGVRVNAWLRRRFGLPWEEASQPFVDKIAGFVVHGGRLYDASAAGVYDTAANACLDDRIVTSIEVLDGKLATVPHYRPLKKWADRFKPHSTHEPHAGHLVEVGTDKVLVERVEPHDGSGFKHGSHFTANGLVYRKHGNSCTEISSISIKTGKVKSSLYVHDTWGFAAYDTKVYDIRAEHEKPATLRESDKGDGKVLLTLPEKTYPTSIFGDDSGIIIGVFHPDDENPQKQFTDFVRVVPDEETQVMMRISRYAELFAL